MYICMNMYLLVLHNLPDCKLLFYDNDIYYNGTGHGVYIDTNPQLTYTNRLGYYIDNKYLFRYQNSMIHIFTSPSGGVSPNATYTWSIRTLLEGYPPDQYTEYKLTIGKGWISVVLQILIINRRLYSNFYDGVNNITYPIQNVGSMVNNSVYIYRSSGDIYTIMVYSLA